MEMTHSIAKEIAQIASTAWANSGERKISNPEEFGASVAKVYKSTYETLIPPEVKPPASAAPQ